MQVVLAIWCAFTAGFAAGFGIRAAISAHRRKLRRQLDGAIARPFILPGTSRTEVEQGGAFEDATKAPSSPDAPKPAVSSYKLH